MSTTPSSRENDARSAAVSDAGKAGAAPRTGSRIRPSLRRDAASNRRRILEVAERVLRDEGHDAPVSALSNACELAEATIYRHFPSRDALVQALYQRAVDRYQRATDVATAEPDVLRRVERLLRLDAAAQVDCHRCGGWFADTFPERVRAHRATVRAVLGDSLAQAREAGVLRSNITVDDLLLTLSGVDGVLRAGPADPAAAAQRVITLVLRGIGSPPHGSPDPAIRPTSADGPTGPGSSPAARRPERA